MHEVGVRASASTYLVEVDIEEKIRQEMTVLRNQLEAMTGFFVIVQPKEPSSAFHRPNKGLAYAASTGRF